MNLLARGATMLLAMLWCTLTTAQSIGIGTDTPIATLDVRTTDSQSAVNIDRELDSASGSTSAFAISDDSDWSAMEIVQNDALNSQEVMHVIHDGLGDGLFVELANSSNGSSGVEVWTYGDGQSAFQSNNIGSTAWGMLNLLDANGIGMYNLMIDDGGVSVFTDMDDVTGSGYFFTNLDIGDLPNPTTGGDGFALDVFVNTQTASVGSTVYGAVIGGDQYGTGHGMIINHNGTNGRNAEFNVTNAANTDATVFATSAGTGEVVFAQQNNSAIGSTINVGSFQYAGTESRDHRAVYGYSAPANGYGIGGLFSGDAYGVVGIDAGNATSGVHAVGNMSATGTKPFLIDHPLDPENSYLRHFAIESNEVLNMYRGVARISRGGTAVVELPEYFSSININVSYQLTAIGTPQQPYIAREVEDNRFVIGGMPGTKVSWTIYANRNDAFVRNNPDKVSVEFPKRDEDRGKYLDPRSHGKEESLGIFYVPVKVEKPAVRDLSNVMENARVAQETARDAVTEKVPGARDLPAQPRERLEIKVPVRTMDEIH